MTETMETVGILPLKRTSRRLPEKNFLKINNKPLWEYPFRVFLESPHINRIVWTIASDLGDYYSSFVRHMYGIVEEKQHSKQVYIINQPESISTSESTAHDFLSYDHKKLKESNIHAKTYVFSHPCNPLITCDMIHRAIELHKSYYPHSVIAVTELKQKVWMERNLEPFGKAVNHNPLKLLPTQNLDPLYIENCSLYVFNAQEFEKTGSHQSDCPVLMPVGMIEGWDIDVLEEFEIAKSIIEGRNRDI